MSLVGTTDTDLREDLDKIHATREDVDYILENYGRIGFIMRDDQIVYALAATHPLVTEIGKSEADDFAELEDIRPRE